MSRTRRFTSTAAVALVAGLCLQLVTLAQVPPVPPAPTPPPKRDLTISVQQASKIDEKMDFGSAQLEFCLNILIKVDPDAPEGPDDDPDYYHQGCSLAPHPTFCVEVNSQMSRQDVANALAAAIKNCLPADAHDRVTVVGETVVVEGVSTEHYTETTPVEGSSSPNSNHPTLIRDTIDY